VKRRLTLAILGTAAAALLIAGLGTLALSRIGARNAARDDVVSQAEVAAQLIALSQEGLTRATGEELDQLRDQFCNEPPPLDAAPAQQDAVVRLQALLCVDATTTAGLEQVTAAVCDDGSGSSLAPYLAEEVISAGEVFCADPSADTLGGLRSAFCTQPSPEVGPASGRRRLAQARRLLCTAAERRSAQRDALQATLEGQDIELVVVTPGGTFEPGTQLPDGLTTADVPPSALLEGSTVSGSRGRRVFAAAPVDADAGYVQAVVVAQTVDPVPGSSVRWFALSAGVTLLIGAVVATRLGQALTSPLRRATAATARIAAGDLEVRLPEQPSTGRSPDELDELGHGINQMTEALARSRGLERQFLLSITHDLRTPLTSIRGWAEAIVDHTAPDPGRAASVILDESARLERLVADLLDLARLEARTFRFHPADVDAAQVVGGAVEGLRPGVEGVGLRLELVPDAGPVPARADPDRLRQVVANLVDNARRYATAVISVAVTRAATGARIEVRDDGPGIAPEDLPHVFERLYQAARTPRHAESGSGLGLAIVRELVEGMGGTVTATSAPGAGAAIVVTLPGPLDGPPPRPDATGAVPDPTEADDRPSTNQG
jgi:two-component system sensor histidine kinase BaeS